MTSSSVDDFDMKVAKISPKEKHHKCQICYIRIILRYLVKVITTIFSKNSKPFGQFLLKFQQKSLQQKWPNFTKIDPFLGLVASFGSITNYMWVASLYMSVDVRGGAFFSKDILFGNGKPCEIDQTKKFSFLPHSKLGFDMASC